jgi:hypothetical protein
MTDPTWPEPTTLDRVGRADYAEVIADYDGFIEELLRNTPESWGSSEGSAESIVVDYIRALEARVQALGGSLERHADAPERWRWLASTRQLQRDAYGDNEWPKQGLALAHSVQMNTTALIAELGEMLNEVGWKPWVESRGWVNREQYLKELVDCGHFLANLAVAVGCTDEEWEQRYQDKQALNTQRQAAGDYDGVKGKCHVCRRALDDDGVRLRENPRHPGTFQTVCMGCGAIVASNESFGDGIK